MSVVVFALATNAYGVLRRRKARKKQTRPASPRGRLLRPQPLRVADFDPWPRVTASQELGSADRQLENTERTGRNGLQMRPAEVRERSDTSGAASAVSDLVRPQFKSLHAKVRGNRGCPGWYCPYLLVASW